MKDSAAELAEMVTDCEWDAARTDRAWRGLSRKRRRRAAVRAASAAALVLLVGGSVWAARAPQVGDGSVARSAVAAAPAAPEALEFPPDAIEVADIVAEETGARARVLANAPERTALVVVDGKHRIRLPRDHSHQVEVVAGDVTINVYAAEFSVARYDEATEVWAHDGDLRVVYHGKTVLLQEGAHRRFGSSASLAPAPARERAAIADVPDWRPLARDGNYERAHQLLNVHGGLGDRVEDLLLAADVYRITSHPDQAAKVLDQVVTRHRRDPRAALAAFTLGRVLLDDLGRPTAAARAFATARELAPAGALAEDALAREVEAWSKAGQQTRARQQAQRYIDSYPRGHRTRAVRQYGAL